MNKWQLICPLVAMGLFAVVATLKHAAAARHQYEQAQIRWAVTARQTAIKNLAAREADIKNPDSVPRCLPGRNSNLLDRACHLISPVNVNP